MTERKQARAMDLPEYPCPPTMGHIASHAGSWGWANPTGAVAQDHDGYLWVKASTHLAPKPSTSHYLLGVWAEGGLEVYVPRAAYGHIRTVETAGTDWVPVSRVLKEPPGYAQSFGPEQ